MSRTGKRTISSLPTELLGLIITHVSLVEPSAPLRLARVSRVFYHVSMSTPGAWTKVFLRLPSAGQSHTMDSDIILWSATRKAKMWFQRSGACPVDIIVEMEQTSLPPVLATHASPTNDLDPGFQGDEDALMQEEWGILLLPHVLSCFRHRIRSLKLHTTTPEEAQAFFDALYPPAPLEFGPHDHPLEELILVAASDGTTHAHSSTRIDRMPTSVKCDRTI